MTTMTSLTSILRGTSLAAMTLMTLGLLARPAMAGATITGKVKLDAAGPADKEIKMDADPKCAALHPTPAKNDNFTTNADGTVQNVFVYIEGDSLKGKTFPAPATPALLDQKGCQYFPKVQGVMAKAPFDIQNSDETLHNVHALPKNSKEFNIGMPTKGMKVTKTFDAAERMVKIKCDVHPWMFAYVGVMEHPYFASTMATGSFTIKDVPAGKYKLYAWHNKFANTPEVMDIEVKDGETKTQDITLKAANAAAK
jgi:hypothetical protein